MLTIADVAKSYGTRLLFEEVSLFVARTDRYGLVGANGTGKTTLFNLILGVETPDAGTITWDRGADFGYLPQETAPAGDETILHLATSSPPAAAGSDHADPEVDWTLEPRAKKVLAGLGFREHLFRARTRRSSRLRGRGSRSRRRRVGCWSPGGGWSRRRPGRLLRQIAEVAARVHVMVPASGVSTPRMRLKRVVLPVPLAPTRP